MPKFATDILKEVEMDDEFREIVEKYAEKELTPVEMDLKVRMDRVIYILNRALAAIQVMMYLPSYLENDGELLRKYLQPQDACFIFKLLNRYGATFDTSSYKDKYHSAYWDILEKTNARRQPSKFAKYLSNLTDPMAHPHISNVINILFENKCIRQMARNSDPALTKTEPSVLEFLNTMENFKQVVKDKIYVTGEEEDLKDKELRQAYKHNVLVEASIKELEARLEKQRQELGDQLKKKVAIFQRYNDRMEKIKVDFKYRIEYVLVESEKEMMNRTVTSEERQLHLAEEAKRMTKQFDMVLEDNLAQEKVSRSKKFKTETQLQNWLIKYDQDIGERQAEYEVLKAKFDEEKEAKDELEEKFEDQEEEYVVLMKEKAEEDERIYMEMCWQFLKSRSARIIQRAWRQYIERKKARRKGKKGKGKGKGKGAKPNAKPAPVSRAKPEKQEEKSYFESAMARKLTEKTDADLRVQRGDDPTKVLAGAKTFTGEVFEEIKDPNAFAKSNIDSDKVLSE